VKTQTLPSQKGGEGSSLTLTYLHLGGGWGKEKKNGAGLLVWSPTSARLYLGGKRLSAGGVTCPEVTMVTGRERGTKGHKKEERGHRRSQPGKGRIG